jgi:two-component system, cell cycle response regulator DivK
VGNPPRSEWVLPAAQRAMAEERILIVDDDLAHLRLVSRLLRFSGFDVRTARDARSAQDAIVAFRPRLVLLDLRLPGVDGLELARRIRADHDAGAVRIVAVTAAATREDEASARAAGCDAYVTKPIDTRALAALVVEVLATR